MEPKQLVDVEGNPAWKAVPYGAIVTAQSGHASGMTLRAIAAELTEAGFVAPSGKPYGPEREADAALARSVARDAQPRVVSADSYPKPIGRKGKTPGRSNVTVTHPSS